jgi:hypothetical protein
MHYSIQQDLARNRYDDRLRAATDAHRATEARETRAGEPARSRLQTLFAAVPRRRPHLRPLPVA